MPEKEGTPEETDARTRRVDRVLALMSTIAEEPTADLDAVAEELAGLAGDPSCAGLLELAGLMLTVRRATEQGNESALRHVPERVARLRGSLPDHPAIPPLYEMISISADLAAANQRGDLAAVRHHLRAARDLIEGLPPGSPLRSVVAQGFAPAAASEPFLDDETQREPTEAQLAALAALAAHPGLGPQRSGLADGMALLRMGAETDTGRIDQAIARFRQVVEGTADRDPQRGFCLVWLALVLYRRSEVTGRTDTLPEARTLLHEARRLLGGPQHPQWALASEILTDIHLRIGEHDEALRTVREAQRGPVWRVLLETDPAGGQLAARDAARDAVDHARRCLVAGDPADALEALDAGRGLMLFAATELHRVPARLEAAGHRDLARQWSRDTALSDDLRRRVVAALTAGPAEGLFDPPSLREVQVALARLDADALVYLVPADPPLGGLAMLAPAAGPAAFMVLPYLRLEAGSDIDRYLTALRARDAVGQHQDRRDTSEFARRVNALCDWAWRTAIGPLLERYLPSLPPRADGGVPRIVLVPMGELARIPWSAARRSDGVRAVELAAISHAVSARLLCDNAALPPLRPGPTGLIVADPDTGGRLDPLRAARAEAHAIRRSFYLGARYVGRLPDDRISPSGAGTAGDVRGWLRNRGPSAGGMLHLACHGSYASGPGADAHLALAGGELGVNELVDLLAAVPDRALALVVLAACNSGRSVYGYDEAYSLGTGFLAGNTRSVLSTQWSVPDTATSSLMYLFHHHLRREGRSAGEALRRAQLWMLDPHRVPPPGMPPALVPGDGADHDPADVLAWAGFVHYGQ